MNEGVYFKLTFPRWMWFILAIIQCVMFIVVPYSVPMFLPVIIAGGITLFAGVACSMMLK